MHAEEQAKQTGMNHAAASNGAKLLYVRQLAVWIALHQRCDGKCSSDDVRLYMQKNKIDLGTGNWWGSLFKDGNWEVTDERVKCKHEGSHAREVRVWRLKSTKGRPT